ncbi:hypothetical protein PGB90_003029 [Kerria lacca]
MNFVVCDKLLNYLHIKKKKTVNSDLLRYNTSSSLSPSSSTSSSSSLSSSRSSRSASSNSTDEEIKLLQRLSDERKRLMEEKRKQKELMKANETPEEKRLRRLKKKEAKELKKKTLMGWDNDYLHYTNNDNPFGDANLLSTFVWDKKLSKDGLVGVTREELEMRNRQKMEENRRELEKVKKRRLQQELERQKREEEISRLQRMKEAAQFEEWERQEDQFHLEQARLRSQIRIQDGRAKPIDLLAKYISAEDDVDAIEMHEPYTYLNGLSIKDLEDLVEDIKVYMELEKGKNLNYWNDITVLVEDELQKLRKLERQAEFEAGRREGIHHAVTKDVISIFRGKSVSQLESLQKQIRGKITSGEKGIDVGYWESLLSQLKAHMARARLRDRHQENLKKKLELLKAEQGVERSEHTDSTEQKSTKVKIESEEEIMDVSRPIQSQEETPDIYEEYNSALYSPEYVSVDSLEPGTIIVSEEDDLSRLKFARLQVQSSGSRVESVFSKEELALQREARKGMTADEVEFSVESNLENQIYLWSDKYRPRKPRYFNRVHTGFEWNKYNQTHYDMDNPPPKIVQGYKFNIFYPDLIDKNSTPEYYLTTCRDNSDFAILRFHAGPPYEDIAFKVVHREWEYSYKKGFRCQFQNNIFQLWFHFKRYRYRR